MTKNTLIPEYSDILEKVKEDRRLKKSIYKIIKNGTIGVNSILNGKKTPIIRTGDMGEYELKPELKENPNLVSCYIDTNGNLNEKFYRKFNRYFSMYKEPLKRARKIAQEKGEAEGGKKLGVEKKKEVMISFSNLIHAFGDNLETTIFEDILKQEASSVNLLTKEIILKYEEFSDDKRMQGILKNAYIFALEKGKNGDKEEGYYFINRKKLKQHIEHTFTDEFDGISKIFNRFYFASGKKDLSNLEKFSGEITPENLKIAAKKIDDLFIQIFHLNQNGIAFKHLNPAQLVESFLEKYLNEKNFTKDSLLKFRELIDKRKKYLEAGEDSKKYLNRLLRDRKLSFKKEEKTEIQNISIEEISYDEFLKSGPDGRSNWFLGNLFEIDEEGNITSKTVKNIPGYLGEKQDIFKGFCEFMKKFYKKYNFSEEKIKNEIKQVIKFVGENGGNISIKQLYEEKSTSLQILRAWIKYYIIWKDNKDFKYENFENYFSEGEGAKDMVIEGFNFEDANIQISSQANYNSVGDNISEMFNFNTERSERGRINTDDDRFKTKEGKNFFYISELFLPLGYNDETNLDEIIEFQKLRIEQINDLISTEKVIFSNNCFFSENYLKILEENGFISGTEVDKKKLWNLRIALKYSIFINKKLKKSYENTPQDYDLLNRINNNLNLGLEVAKIKRPYRSNQKSLTKYKGDFYKNCDIVRAKKVDKTLLDSVKSMQKIVNDIHSSEYNDEIVQVTILDSTLNPNELGLKPSKYRDLKNYLRTKSGTPIEVQFLCEEIERYKNKGISIEKDFLPLVSKNNTEISEESYKFLEKMCLERGLKIPNLFKNLLKGKNYTFNEELYEDNELIKSEFFYEVRRECGNKEFEILSEKLESLYYDKVWGKISGELNEFYWKNK